MQIGGVYACGHLLLPAPPVRELGGRLFPPQATASARIVATAITQSPYFRATEQRRIQSVPT
jgi:hypothetical protein